MLWSLFSSLLETMVLGIRDMLVRIRILCGSIPLTKGSGSCYFRQWPSRWQLKIIFSLNFFVYYFLKLHLHHFSRKKSHKEVTKQEGKITLKITFFCPLVIGLKLKVTIYKNDFSNIGFFFNFLNSVMNRKEPEPQFLISAPAPGGF